MADPVETKNTTTFAEKEFDVSINIVLWILLCPLTFGAPPYSTKLHLGTEEVTRYDVNLCGKTEAKLPYGELGNVAKGNVCCCVSFASAFGDISPGWGCDAELCEEIVQELKARQRGRGDTAQIKRAEQTLERLDHIEAKLDKIIEHLKMERD